MPLGCIRPHLLWGFQLPGLKPGIHVRDNKKEQDGGKRNSSDGVAKPPIHASSEGFRPANQTVRQKSHGSDESAADLGDEKSEDQTPHVLQAAESGPDAPPFSKQDGGKRVRDP